MSRRSPAGRCAAVAAAVAALSVWLALAGPGAAPATATVAKAPAAAQLERFPSCTRFLAHVRRAARPLVGPYGLGGSGSPFLGSPTLPERVRADGALAPVAAAPGGDASGESAPAASSPGVDFSGTNLQEAGVDEPDIVKTDGRRVFAIVGAEVHAVAAEGAGSRRLGTIAIARLVPTGLLLRGERLFVIGEEPGAPIDLPRPLPLPAPPAVDRAVASSPAIAPVASTAVLVEVDVSDPAAMRERARLRVDGRLLAARLTGTTARLVVASTPDAIATSVPLAPGVAAERLALRANRRALARSRPADWLPGYTLRRAGVPRVTRGPAVRCGAVAHTDRFAGLGLISVLTVDLAGPPRLVDGDAVMTDGSLVYASPTSLYVASQRFEAPEPAAGDVAPGRVATHIHRFDTSDPARATYAGSGSVPGDLVNQFAMSEHAGHLRVASTDEPPFTDGAIPGSESESFVSVLALGESGLPTTGRVGGLGRGERIFSVRFIGARGYVVTFRQVDPLYTLDLADPAAPAVRGELKIPGFSTYLHPVGEDRLIGIGQDATDDGRATGLQVSLFDVADPARPRRLAQQRLGGRFSSSEAEYDHHAVLYWAPTGLLVVPFQDHGADVQSSSAGAVGLRVSEPGSFGSLDEVGRLAHPSPGPEGGPPAVRRSLVSGDTLYTLSDEDVLASDLATLARRAHVRLAP